MGVGQSEGAVPATGAIATVSRPLQVGYLVSASAVVSAGAPVAGACWVYLALCQGKPEKYHVTNPLAKGYITEEDPLLWDGHIYLNGTFILAGFSRSTAACVIRIFAHVEISR